MITKIERIADFGVFQQLLWPPGIPEFRTFNVLYGWNYSGKTTISRVFRCFELARLHPDFPSAQVKLRSDDGVLHCVRTPDTLPYVRVFNSDFVRENLRFEDGDANSFVVLGDEEISGREMLKVNKARERRLAALFNELQNERRSIELKVSDSMREYASRRVKMWLRIPDYNQVKFKAVVDACQKDFGSYLLQEEQIDRYFSICQNNERLPSLGLITILPDDLENVKRSVRDVLHNVMFDDNRVRDQLADEEAQEWVQSGIRFHDKKSECVFCGSKLPVAIVEWLRGMLSREYSDLMGSIKQAEANCEGLRGYAINCPPTHQVYREFQDAYERSRRRLDLYMALRQGYIDQMIADLVAKKANPFGPPLALDESFVANGLGEIVSEINAIIAAHNSRSQEFASAQNEARVYLLQHVAAEYVTNESYAERSERLAYLQGKIEHCERLRQCCSDRIKQLESRLASSQKAAERVNNVLGRYFGDGRLLISPGREGAFNITRFGQRARNLSDGERTAIAFSYFVATLQDGRELLSSLAVVIDDPISSLDSRHLFNTYAIVQSIACDVRQLFVLTHSFEFFTLLKEIGKELAKVKKKSLANYKGALYLQVRRVGQSQSTVDVIPGELLHFNSEYHYLFNQLVESLACDGSDAERLLALPNVVRRFMEAFGGIVIPISAGLHEKLETLMPDATSRALVWKFINQYSHNTTVMRSLSIPDLSECLDVVRLCLDSVKGWDIRHYDYLCQAIAEAKLLKQQ